MLQSTVVSFELELLVESPPPQPVAIAAAKTSASAAKCFPPPLIDGILGQKASTSVSLLYSLVVAFARRSAKLNERLPRGRHGLPREAVTESQRSRIHQAMIEVVSHRGYPETRVVDVIGVAGVSRKTFYELFESKEDCFLAAYDVLLGTLLGEATEAFESSPGASWAERISMALEVLLEHLAAHPEEARFAVVEVLAAGPKALARRDAALRQFTGFLEAGRSETRIELPGITTLALAGGINELLYSEILHGAVARLPSRLPDLIFWITLPFLGAEGAAAERERVRLQKLPS
jgi:AcrR family transcriptional regulator